MSQHKKTHFGYQNVKWEEKTQKVDGVFSSVADSYDLMNDLMSFGVHRLWKKFAIHISQIKNSERVLDLAGGSGDLSSRVFKNKKFSGEIYVTDINAAMLKKGRDRLIDEGQLKHSKFVIGNAEILPYPDNFFDCILIGFGLRNVTDKDAALRSMFRVCKPGGRVLILEFSKVDSKLINTIYNWYSFNILPKMGKLVANDEKSYQYLAESIRMHPPQEELKKMIEQAGFEDCTYHNLTGGLVALHLAYKY